jgi:hypothetical protein
MRERENNIKTGQEVLPASRHCTQPNIDQAQNTEYYCPAYPKLKLSFKNVFVYFVDFAPGKFKCSDYLLCIKIKKAEQSKYKASPMVS